MYIAAAAEVCRVERKKYTNYETLEYKYCGTRWEKLGDNRVCEYIDKYGNKVISIIKDIPCFDSFDRVYDSSHVLVFFQQHNHIYALYYRGGYRKSVMLLFSNITPISANLKELFKCEGFPVK